MSVVPQPSEPRARPPLLPERAAGLAFDLYAHARPAGLFCGDFYLTAETPGALWIALGDVAGKGLSAALVSAMAQEVLEPRMRRGAGDPVDVVRAVHAALLSELRTPRRFLSLVVARLDAAGRLHLVNAGHFPPLVAVPDSRVEEVPSHGPVVGVFADSAWTALERCLEPGESLVLYSDGLLEATSPQGHLFGCERLRRAVARHAGAATARDLALQLLAEEARHREGRSARDDTTVLVLRVLSGEGRDQQEQELRWLHGRASAPSRGGPPLRSSRGARRAGG